MILSNLVEKFTALAPREKGLIALAVVAVVWGCWDSFFYTPITKEQTQLKQRLADIDTQLTAQQQMAVQLQNQAIADPNVGKRKQLLELKSHYQVLQGQVRDLNKNFVPPALMAELLNDMLKQNNQLTLIKFETLPVTPLFNFKYQENMIYRHGLILRFSGNYLAILNYLKALESMPWHLVWDSIDYQVKEYPTAEITLRVYTLSLQKEWLNV